MGTGRARISGTLDAVDPLRHGDVLSLSGLSSGGDMNYGRLGYEALLDGAGTRVGVAYSALHYRLGDPLSALDAHGTAEVAARLGATPTLVADTSAVRAWIELDKVFE